MRPLHLLFLGVCLLPLGCAFRTVGGVGGATPQEAAMRVQPPRAGEQRFVALKPAPDGVLVVFENIGAPQPDPNVVEAGYAMTTLESTGWVVHEGGGMGGTARNGLLVYVTPSDHAAQHIILFGKILDARVVQVNAVFSSGWRVQDTLTNGLFGMAVNAPNSLCQLELLDGGGQRVHLYSLDGSDKDLAELMPSSADRARQDCTQ